MDIRKIDHVIIKLWTEDGDCRWIDCDNLPEAHRWLDRIVRGLE